MARKPDMKAVARVEELRKKKLSDREIGRIMGVHHKQVQRWRGYAKRGDIYPQLSKA